MYKFASKQLQHLNTYYWANIISIIVNYVRSFFVHELFRKQKSTKQKQNKHIKMSQQPQQQELTLSERGRNYKVMPPYFHALMKYFADPFNAETNPNGVINLGVAENMLCAKELAAELAKLRVAAPVSEGEYCLRQ